MALARQGSAIGRHTQNSRRLSSAGGDEAESTDEDAELVSSDEDADATIQDEMRTISLGALADAQAAVGSQRRRRTSETQDSSVHTRNEKLKLLRDRLAELKKIKGHGKKRKRDAVEKYGAHDQETSDSAPEAASSAGHPEFSSGRHDSSFTRSSKHAPTIQSSKTAVSRKRTVLDLPPAENPYHSRDPRFSSLSGPVKEQKLHRDYAFLAEYREAEVEAMRDSLRNAKKNNASEEDVEELKRELGAMENKLRAAKEKERERDVLRRHRREEKDRVKQGKKPFYLKPSDVKKKAKEEKWEGMKAKERDKATKRKKAREDQKEKRRMPNERRMER